MEKLLAFLIAAAAMALDAWCDSRLARLNLPKPVKEELERLEDELIVLLKMFGPKAAKALARAAIGKALKKAFPNDPTTGDWG
jgi:hypothetical protein